MVTSIKANNKNTEIFSLFDRLALFVHHIYIIYVLYIIIYWHCTFYKLCLLSDLVIKMSAFCWRNLSTWICKLFDMNKDQFLTKYKPSWSWSKRRDCSIGMCRALHWRTEFQAWSRTEPMFSIFLNHSQLFLNLSQLFPTFLIFSWTFLNFLLNVSKLFKRN